jgi:hypothetical protein
MRNDHENRNSGSVFHTHPPCTHNVGPTLTTHPAASGLPRCRPSRHRRPPRAALQIRTLAGGRREKMGAEGNTNAGRRGRTAGGNGGAMRRHGRPRPRGGGSDGSRITTAATGGKLRNAARGPGRPSTRAHHRRPANGAPSHLAPPPRGSRTRL